MTVDSRFAAALQAFRTRTLWSSFRSRFFSLDKLCHIEIDTKGAHSFLTIPLSNDWNALMMNERRWVLTVADRVVSNVIESIRRNMEENSAGLSVNKSIQT